MAKRDLGNLLAQHQEEPEIRRGVGYVFSTEQPEQVQDGNMQKADTARADEDEADTKIERRSVRVRADLLKQCKRISVEEDITLAEVVEAAIAHWLQQESKVAKW